MKTFLKKHKAARVLAVLVLVLFCLLAAVVLFLWFWPVFGGRASEEDREDYAARAENYRDGKFYNDGDFQISGVFCGGKEVFQPAGVCGGSAPC